MAMASFVRCRLCRCLLMLIPAIFAIGSIRRIEFLPLPKHVPVAVVEIGAQQQQREHGNSLESADTTPNQAVNNSRSSLDTETTQIPFQRISQNQSMAACMIIRNDNHLLHEWIAYHYTVLPLRHLIIGNDENITEDPREVLHRWNGTDLHYQVWDAGSYTQKIQYKYQDHHYRYVKRQNVFLKKCLTYFWRQRNIGWVAMIDTDEYITLNPLRDAEDQRIYHQPFQFDNDTLIAARQLSPNETLWDRVSTRKRLRYQLGLERTVDKQQPSTFIPTILDVLEDYSSRYGTLPCHTIPRLRYSAVTENWTTLAETLCHPKLNIPSSSLNVSKLSTIRFLYHVPPENFEHNTWGKVMIDLRRLVHGSLRKVHTVHGPIEECIEPFFPDLLSLFRVNHYINDWSVFSGRVGDPRERRKEEWSEMSHARHGTSCYHMHGWLNDLVSKFGIDQARYLLGQELL